MCGFKSESSGFLRRHTEIHAEPCKWPPDYVGIPRERIARLVMVYQQKQKQSRSHQLDSASASNSGGGGGSQLKPQSNVLDNSDVSINAMAMEKQQQLKVVRNYEKKRQNDKLAQQIRIKAAGIAKRRQKKEVRRNFYDDDFIVSIVEKNAHTISERGGNGI